MPRKKTSDDCPICGRYLDVLCTVGSEWYDGKKYACICFVCASVIRTCRVIIHDPKDATKDEWVVYDYEEDDSTFYLHTPAELTGMGFGKLEVEKSIKAVKSVLRRAKKSISRS